MRTTVIIEDSLWTRVKGVALKRQLSDFINRCLEEHFARVERAARMKELEKAYLRAAKGTATPDEFAAIDREGWPEW